MLKAFYDKVTVIMQTKQDIILYIYPSGFDLLVKMNHGVSYRRFNHEGLLVSGNVIFPSDI